MAELLFWCVVGMAGFGFCVGLAKWRNLAVAWKCCADAGGSALLGLCLAGLIGLGLRGSGTDIRGTVAARNMAVFGAVACGLWGLSTTLTAIAENKRRGRRLDWSRHDHHD